MTSMATMTQQKTAVEQGSPTPTQKPSLTNTHKAMMAMNAQTPKSITVIKDGQGGAESRTLPESANRVIQTIIEVGNDSLLPSHAHLADKIDAVRAKGAVPHIILTADILRNNTNPESIGDMAAGEDYKYHVVSGQELAKQGLDRQSAQLSANTMRQSVRQRHLDQIVKARSHVPF